MINKQKLKIVMYLIVVCAFEFQSVTGGNVLHESQTLCLQKET